MRILLIFLLYFTVISSASAQFLCKETFRETNTAKEEKSQLELSIEGHPHANIFSQILTTIARIEGLLGWADKVTIRQSNKVINRTTQLIEKLSKKNEMTEKEMDSLVDLNQKLGEIETKLEPIAEIHLIDPYQLKRYMITAEPLHSGIKYKADLPGFGEVTIELTKSVAEAFNSGNGFRRSLFPYIFKGKASKKANSGIKQLTHSNVTRGDALWELHSLKLMYDQRRVFIARSGDRFVFFKVEKNHNRVEYGNKDILEDYLKNFEVD